MLMAQQSDSRNSADFQIRGFSTIADSMSKAARLVCEQAMLTNNSFIAAVYSIWIELTQTSRFRRNLEIIIA